MYKSRVLESVILVPDSDQVRRFETGVVVVVVVSLLRFIIRVRMESGGAGLRKGFHLSNKKIMEQKSASAVTSLRDREEGNTV